MNPLDARSGAAGAIPLIKSQRISFFMSDPYQAKKCSIQKIEHSLFRE